MTRAFRKGQLVRWGKGKYQIGKITRKGPRDLYSVEDYHGKPFLRVNTSLQKVTNAEDREFWNHRHAAINQANKAEKPEYGFIVLAEDGNGGYEIQDFKNVDMPSVFHSQEAAIQAIKKSTKADEEKLPGALDEAGLEYYIAEIKRPVRVSISRRIEVKIS